VSTLLKTLNIFGCLQLSADLYFYSLNSAYMFVIEQKSAAEVVIFVKNGTYAYDMAVLGSESEMLS
jgi:hypothetical protein